MQVLRFNPFGQIHKGLRALLYDSALLLQHTNFTEEEEIASACQRVTLVNALFEHHAHIEDSRIFPLIASYAPQIVTDFEEQHQTDHALSTALEKCLARFTETNSAAQNAAAGEALSQSFNAFLAFNVDHMYKEETIVNKCLWQYYSDEELLQEVQEISRSIPPEQNRHFIFWMLKGLATVEIIAWYNVVKQAVPPPVFQFFCELAEEALPEKKWNRIKDALQEGALLA